MVQLESAVRRNPKAPDFGGLDVMLEGHTDASGAAATQGFDQWVMEQQRAKAQIAKQGRLLREEAETEKKRGKGEGKGEGKGKAGKEGQQSES